MNIPNALVVRIYSWLFQWRSNPDAGRLYDELGRVIVEERRRAEAQGDSDGRV